MLLSKARLIGPVPAIYIGNSINFFPGLLNTRLRPDLGVTLDQNRSWIPHLKEVIRNFAKNIQPPEEIQVSTKRCVGVFF